MSAGQLRHRRLARAMSWGSGLKNTSMSPRLPSLQRACVHHGGASVRSRGPFGRLFGGSRRSSRHLARRGTPPRRRGLIGPPGCAIIHVVDGRGAKARSASGTSLIFDPRTVHELGHGMVTSPTSSASVRAATYRGSWRRALSAVAEVTTNQRRWPPLRHEHRTAVCLSGLSKPFHAANATAQSSGWWWCSNRNRAMSPASAEAPIRGIEEIPDPAPEWWVAARTTMAAAVVRPSLQGANQGSP
jgi:hypothetical protein